MLTLRQDRAHVAPGRARDPGRHRADLKLQRSSRDPPRCPACSRRGWPVAARRRRPVGHAAQRHRRQRHVARRRWSSTRPGPRTAQRTTASTSPGSRRRPRTCRSSATTRCRTSTTRCGSSASSPTCRCRRSGWIEPTGEVLGTPFFLMDRIDGVVPPDVLPYNFGDNWLSDAAPEDQRRLAGQHRRGDRRAARASRTPRRRSRFLDPRPATRARTPLARNLARMRAWYEFAVARHRPRRRSSSARWPGSRPTCPTTSGAEAVLCWGDSRIGNVMYRDFEPVAVLDWEMAALGPREMDLSWMVFAHLVFESITDVLRDARACRTSCARRTSWRRTSELTGVELGDLHLVPRLQRRPVVRRLHAHRRPADPLRRDRAARTTSRRSSTTSR